MNIFYRCSNLKLNKGIIILNSSYRITGFHLSFFYSAARKRVSFKRKTIFLHISGQNQMQYYKLKKKHIC